MAPRFDTISFLSDYGTADEFVGVVKGVLASLAPEARVLDISHEVAAHDVRAGSLMLARAAQYLPPGVVLAVVDPGVGTARKAVAIEVGKGQSYLVGPDNGLLASAVSMVGGADRAVVLDNPEHQLPAPGATFAGRDVFAPAAAALCNGTPLEELGTMIDPAALLPGVVPISQTDEDGAILAEVLWVDRFGNLQLNVDPIEIAAWGTAVTVVAPRGTRTGQRCTTYGDIPTGGVGIVIDSYGLLSVAVDRSSAALELGADEGDSITLRPSEGGGVSVPVQLTSRPTMGERPA